MYFTDPILARYADETDVFVFDMNGLIVDDEPLQLAASNEVLARAGYSLTITEEQWIQHCVGHKPREWFATLLGDTAQAADLDALVRDRDALSAEMIGKEARTLARPGVRELIAAVAAAPDKKLALATSTTQSAMEMILGPETLDLLSLFDFLICGDQVKKAKPDPEIFLAVKTHFGETARYLVFDDAASGVLSAIRAGMLCFAVPNSFTATQDLSPATLILDNMTKDARVL